jgi:hypothetical protein
LSACAWCCREQIQEVQTRAEERRPGDGSPGSSGGSDGSLGSRSRPPVDEFDQLGTSLEGACHSVVAAASDGLNEERLQCYGSSLNGVIHCSLLMHRCCMVAPQSNHPATMDGCLSASSAALRCR